jgi:tetratricopeptide (TPR) repeat protein
MVLLRATWCGIVAAFAVVASQPPKSIEVLRKDAFRLAQERKFAEASILYHELRDRALQAQNKELAVQALNSIAGCSFLLYQYRDAIQTYERAHAEAIHIGSQELEGMVAANIASLYASLGETDKALQILRRYPIDGSAIRVESRLDWLILRIQVAARAHDRTEFLRALPLAQAESARPVPEKIAAATPERLQRWPEAQAELRRAWLFDVLSDAYNDLDDLPRALDYAREAYRIRAVYGDSSRLRGLVQQCVLERKSGNLEAAWRISESVVANDGLTPTPMQSFRVRRERALVLLRKGEVRRALVEFRLAMSYPRAWRSEVLPADSTILHFENFMNGEIQREFLDAIASLPAASFSGELARESFWVAEEARFASLRAAYLPRDEVAKRLGAGYWPILRRFQDLQGKVLAGERNATAERNRLESELHQREIQAGLSIPHAIPNGGAATVSQFSQWQRRIPADETVFTFHLSEPASLGWAVTRKGIEMKKLVGRRETDSDTASFLSGLQYPATNRDGIRSSSLTKKLFGEFSYPYRTKPFWTVVVEDTLAKIPVSALPLIDDPSRFLVEAHTIRLLPSATMLQSDAAGAWGKRAFAFADPIYSAADNRSQPGTAQTLELNRLPGTLREAKISFAPLLGSNWETKILSSADATAPNLRLHAQASPDVLHIATHFSADPKRPDLLSIVLSASSTNGPALFSAKDLTAVRTGTKLVVLDGCDSASGAGYPGLGVIGLSRAWLISGAANVVGTLWPIPDSAGPFFPDFYRRIARQPYSSRSISTSLRETQLDLLRRHGPHSAPSYWAAYVLLQRS